jgi:hypothetical protein
MKTKWPWAVGLIFALALSGWAAMAESPRTIEADILAAPQQPQKEKEKGVRGAAERVREAREQEAREAEEADEKGIRGAATRSRDGRIIFTEPERVLVRDWFRTNRRNLPPGLAKRDRLPPGLEKQLRERGTLPPGLQKRMHPVPVALERRLPRLPERHRRVVLGGHLIVLDDETGLIHDVIRDVLR